MVERTESERSAGLLLLASRGVTSCTNTFDTSALALSDMEQPNIAYGRRYVRIELAPDQFAQLQRVDQRRRLGVSVRSSEQFARSMSNATQKVANKATRERRIARRTSTCTGACSRRTPSTSPEERTMRARLYAVVLVACSTGGCRERGTAGPGETRRALEASVAADGCAMTNRVGNAFDAYTRASLPRDGWVAIDRLAEQLEGIDRPGSIERVQVSVDGATHVVATAIGLQCDAFWNAGGRLSWFERDRAGWRLSATLDTGSLARPEIAWSHLDVGRVVLAEVAPSTQGDLVSLRAVELVGGRLEDVVLVERLRATVFSATRTATGVRFRHVVPLRGFSPSSMGREQEQSWRFDVDPPTVETAPVSPWLDALEAECARGAAAIGCGAVLAAATPRSDGIVEIQLEDVPSPELYGCPATVALALVLVMEEQEGSWRVVERRVADPACTRDAGL